MKNKLVSALYFVIGRIDPRKEVDQLPFPVFCVRQQELDVAVVGLERDVLRVAEGLGEDI